MNEYKGMYKNRDNNLFHCLSNENIVYLIQKRVPYKLKVHFETLPYILFLKLHNITHLFINLIYAYLTQ